MAEIKFQEELRLRRLLTEMICRAGGGENVARADLFKFFQLERLCDSAEIQRLWHRRLSCRKPSDRLGVNLHVPFCRSLCSYCYLNNRTPDQISGGLDAYVDELSGQMEMFKKVFSGQRFDYFFFGGGSPDVLTASQMRQLLEGVQQAFMFHPEAERTMECNPGGLSEEQLTVLRDFGVNRISFGVQSLDPQVLAHANRTNLSQADLKRFLDRVRDILGNVRMTLDLLAGLKPDSVSSVLEAFQASIDLKVDSIRLYALSPREDYVARYYQGCRETFDLELRTKMKALKPRIIAWARENGYECFFLDQTLSDGQSWDFVRMDSVGASDPAFEARTLNQSFDYLGIGREAWSLIDGQVTYHQDFDQPDPENPGFRVTPVSGLAGKRAYILKKFTTLNAVCDHEYRARFRSGLEQDFSWALNALDRLGALNRDGSRRVLTAGARSEKFLYLLFFFETHQVYDELKKIRQRIGQV